MIRAVQFFLLSPAYCGGRRAKILMKPGSTIELARRLNAGTLTLGEAFAFLSGLYFRGKLAYANAFAPDRTFVITPTRGLLPPSALVSTALLEEFATVDVSAADPRYRRPLERDVTSLAGSLTADARVVLLGSIASGKYVDILVTLLGRRLHYPPSFVGRGDMSRGGLLLRSVDAGVEIDYAVLEPTSIRHGPRPPKLEPRRAT